MLGLVRGWGWQNLKKGGGVKERTRECLGENWSCFEVVSLEERIQTALAHTLDLAGIVQIRNHFVTVSLSVHSQPLVEKRVFGSCRERPGIPDDRARAPPCGHLKGWQP